MRETTRFCWNLRSLSLFLEAEEQWLVPDISERDVVNCRELALPQANSYGYPGLKLSRKVEVGGDHPEIQSCATNDYDM